LSVDIIEKLVNYGVIGAILAWFMLRFEKKMDDLTKAINDLKDSLKVMVSK